MARKQQMTINEAIALVIRSAGYETLAREWMSRPEDRQEIVRMFTRILERDSRFGRKHADRFVRLVAQRHILQSHQAA